MTSNFLKQVRAAILGALTISPALAVSTPGSVNLTVTINDYTGTSNTRHWSVVCVTTSTGTFITTLGIRGNKYNTTTQDKAVFWTSHWNNHCSTWYTARNGSTNLAADGYTSATAQTYSAPNSPVSLTWNCRDAGNTVVADGSYKFWIQYAEDSGQGPVTTNGLPWTKGTSGTTTNPAAQGSNFTGMSIVWTPALPEIAGEQPAGSNIADAASKAFGTVPATRT